jgi:hypothetical protein
MNSIKDIFGIQSAPAAPDYTGAAQATASGNIAAAQQATRANRVNQYTPYGSLTYQENPNGTWDQNMNLSSTGQQLLNADNQSALGLAGLQNNAMQGVASQQGRGWNDSALTPSAINPGQTAQDAIMSRLNPQFDRRQSALETQLANQGIARGTEAWTNGMTDLNNARNDATSQAALQGIGLGQQARQQGIQEQQYFNSRDLNNLNALRTGSQVTNPTFSSYNQQATTGGADTLGAQQAGYNAQLGNVNANNAFSGSAMQGLFGLGGAYMGKK